MVRCGEESEFFVTRNIVSTLFKKRAIYSAEITIGTPKCPYGMARGLFRRLLIV
jgi:predicted metal-binding protein